MTPDYLLLGPFTRDVLPDGTTAPGGTSLYASFAAQRLGCKATIVMPVTTPHIKVSAVAARCARVILTGDSYDDAYAEAATIGRPSSKGGVNE